MIIKLHTTLSALADLEKGDATLMSVERESVYNVEVLLDTKEYYVSASEVSRDYALVKSKKV